MLQINPYVRFARVHTKPLQRQSVTALDHRIFYCTEGAGEITVRNRAYSMKPGAFLFIRSGVPYYNTSPADGMVLFAYNFDFLCREENMGAPIPFVKSDDFRPEMCLEPHLPGEADKFFDVLYFPEFYKKGTFEEIIEEYNRKAVYCSERCGVLMKDVLLCAARMQKEERNSSQKSKVAAIVSYVKEHFAEPVTNESVSRHFSYHKNYVNRIFKNETGQTLHQFLLTYRMQIAVSLLLSGEYTVSEVGEQVGFPETSHFSKCFKKITGHVPRFYIPKAAHPPHTDDHAAILPIHGAE